MRIQVQVFMYSCTYIYMCCGLCVFVIPLTISHNVVNVSHLIMFNICLMSHFHDDFHKDLSFCTCKM